MIERENLMIIENEMCIFLNYFYGILYNKSIKDVLW